MNRLRLPVLVGVGVIATLTSATGWGQAVSVDATSLMNRLDSIEQRLRGMERNRPAVAQNAAPVAMGSANYSVTELTQRMNELENEMSQQAGSNERVMFAIERLAKRFDDYVKDVDLRLNDLEAKVGRMQAVPQPTVQPAAQPAAAGQPAAAASPSAPAAAVKKTEVAAIPASLGATDLYNKAYAYLTATDYPNAQAWLEEFLKRHPKDKLADNAWYWLGEVQLVQNNPSGAVVSFRNGLKNFPQGAKAPGNLYKMGIALEQLKQPELAKGAWEKLMKDYPKSQEAARAKDKMVQPRPAAR